MIGSAPHARFRLYTASADYVSFVRDLFGGRLWAGNDVERLEREICRRYDVPHALCVPQGRVGIYLAVKHLVRPGQTVVLSPYTIADVINMVIVAGAVPVFADIDRATTNVRPDTIERLIDDRTGAVMVTHLHGMACDIEAVAAICKARGIPLIEDAAQAFGARVGGRRVGTFGDAGVFSFGMYKNVTGFYGGAVVCRDAALDRAMREELSRVPYMSLGMLGAKVLQAWMTDVTTTPWLFRSLVYWIFRLGYLKNIHAINRFVTVELDTSRKSTLPPEYLRRLLPVQARMVLRQLDDVDRCAATRIHFAKLYSKGLSGLPGLILPPFRDDGSFVYNYFPVQYRDRAALVRWAMQHHRDMAVQHLKNCAGLDSFRQEACHCPEAAATAAETILLPNYPTYGEDNVRANIAVIRRFFEQGPGAVGRT